MEGWCSLVFMLNTQIEADFHIGSSYFPESSARGMPSMILLSSSFIFFFFFFASSSLCECSCLFCSGREDTQFWECLQKATVWFSYIFKNFNFFFSDTHLIFSSAATNWRTTKLLQKQNGLSNLNLEGQVRLCVHYRSKSPWALICPYSFLFV